MQNLRHQIREWQQDYRSVWRRRPKVPRITVYGDGYSYRFTYSPELDKVHVHSKSTWGEWRSYWDYKPQEVLSRCNYLPERAIKTVRDWLDSFMGEGESHGKDGDEPLRKAPRLA